MEDGFNFHQEEYAALRREIELTLEEFSRLRRYALFGTAGAFAWIATQGIPPSNFAVVVWWVPTIIPVMGLLMMLTKSARLDDIGAYLAQVETECISDTAKARGWENFRRRDMADDATRNGKIWDGAFVADLVFWCAFILVSITISYNGAAVASVDSQPAVPVEQPTQEAPPTSNSEPNRESVSAADSLDQLTPDADSLDIPAATDEARTDSHHRPIAAPPDSVAVLPCDSLRKFWPAKLRLEWDQVSRSC